MIAPGVCRLKCPKCGRSKIVHSKSDVLGAEDIVAHICPHCEVDMEPEPMGLLGALLGRIRGGWRP